jgi:hypothetical protein
LAAQSKKEPDVQKTITYENRRRELARRVSDGLDVALYWRPSDGGVAIEVVDQRAAHTFELSVARDRALDAFRHPYAYASSRGIVFEALLPQVA